MMSEATENTEPFQVVVKPESFQRSARGQITGEIWVSVGGDVFPGPRWSDLVVAVLHGWLYEALEFSRDGPDTIRLHFMDGPFAIDVERQDSTRCQVTFLERPNKEAIVASYVSARQVMTALVATACIVLEECEVRGWTSRDVVELKMMSQRLANLRSREWS